VFCVPQADALYVGRLAVADAWRRRGVGRALIHAVEEEARRIGAPRLTLRARISLPANLRFFQACGFTIDGEGRHPGYAAPTFYEMAKAIASPSRGDCLG
jgi:GNAT superfamily N-acetyltransferase